MLSSPRPSARLWRVAGALAIAHVVLMFTSFSLQKVAPLGATAAVVAADHVSWPASKGFIGEYLSAMSFLVFLVAAMLIAGLLRGTTELAGWLSATAKAGAVVYVVLTLFGVSALGAALYGGHHGAALAMVTALDQLHWFAISLATVALGVFTLAVAIAVLQLRVLPAWAGFAGLVAGVLCLAAGPGPGMGLLNVSTLVWVAWFVGLAVAALRGPRRAVHATPEVEQLTA